MLKYLLVAGAAALSVPALAQETAPTDMTAPPPAEQPAPESAPPAGEATAQPAPSGTAANGAQIAQIIDNEFPSYDGDKTGDLNQVEFAAWMKKLRTATEPTVDPESEQVKSWIGQAWTAADGDKSGAVSKEELTAFLSRGA